MTDKLEQIKSTLIYERRYCTYLIQYCQNWVDNDDLHAAFEFEGSLIDDMMSSAYSRAQEINEQLEALKL